MRSRERVAVIMSVHLGASGEFFGQAIESMLSQTYEDLHLFVACDGPLNSACESILSALPGDRVTILRVAEQHGLPFCLNRLIDLVLACEIYKYIARMDADDISEKERVERQVAFLEEHPEIAILGTWGKEIDLDGGVIHDNTLPPDHDSLIRFMALRSPLIHISAMIRCALFETGIRYDPKLLQMQDYDLWRRSLLQGARLANLSQYLVRIRVDNGFYLRRSGWLRAVREVRMRYAHICHYNLWSLKNACLLAGFFFLRIAPTWVRRFAYASFR